MRPRWRWSRSHAWALTRTCGVHVQLPTCNKKCADARKARKRQRESRKLEKQELDEKEQVRHTRQLDLAVTARDDAKDDLKKANRTIASLRKELRNLKETTTQSVSTLKSNTDTLKSSNTRVTAVEKQRDQAVATNGRAGKAGGKHKIAVAQHVSFLKTFTGQLVSIAGRAALKSFVKSQQQ